MGQLANKALSVITAIVTIVTFLGFVTAEPVKAWVKTHSEWIFYGLVLFFTATGISLNYLLAERKKRKELEKVLARPSGHDRKLYQDFVTMLPPDGPVIKWLKEDFRSNAFSRDNCRAIEAALKTMRLQSPGFDNLEVKTGYGQLQEALQKFENATAPYLRSDPTNPWVQTQAEPGSQGSDSAVGEINVIHLELVGKYENFLELAHKNKVDE